MASILTNFKEDTGQTLYAFPMMNSVGTAVSLADWATYRKACTEAASPNVGRYSVTLDDGYQDYWVFSGASQPANWNASIDVVLRIVNLPVYNILPVIGTSTNRVAGTTITVFKDELPAVTVAVEDVDFTGLTLEVSIDNMSGDDITVIANADITKGDEYITFTVPTAITATIGQYRWACRDQSGTENLVLVHGMLTVEYAANDD